MVSEKIIRSRGRSRHSYLRLRGAGVRAERNIFGSTTLLVTLYSMLKVQKNENLIGSDLEFCTISLLVLLKY